MKKEKVYKSRGIFLKHKEQLSTSKSKIYGLLIF
jgi:hypothetical protein